MSWAGVTLPEIQRLILLEREYIAKPVRETDGPNDSPQIRIFQKFTGNAPPDAWCMSAQQYCLHQIWPDCPMKISASCQQVRLWAVLNKWLLKPGVLPEPGDIGLVIDVPRDHAHHTFLVSSRLNATKYFKSCEGNTNPAGGREGYGFFERSIRHIGGTTTYNFIRFPRRAA